MTLCVVGCTLISNSKGLHEKIGGNSGYGKSFGVTRTLKLFPPEKSCISSMSAKALFYNPLPAGTVVYCDDFDLGNTDVYTTIKQCTSSYQESTEHMTVVNGAALNCNIAPRIGLILSAVDNFDDEQMSSRFGETEVNNTDEMQDAIYKKQQNEEFRLTKADSVDENTLVCRCMWSIIEDIAEKEGLFEIRIPFVNAITWVDKKHPRSYPFFKDIIRVMALFKIVQREKVGNYYVATIEDYHSAVAMYNKMEKINATKLNTKELNILQHLANKYIENGYFSADRKVSRTDLIHHLTTAYGMTYKNIIDIIHGKHNEGGLLNKVDRLEAELLKDGDHSVPKWFYWYSGTITKDGYAESISLDEELAKTEIDIWRQTIK